MTEQCKKHFKKCTDDIYELYECFKESGFTDEQAMELTSTYVRQSMFDNIIRENDRQMRRSNVKEVRERMKRDMAYTPSAVTMTCGKCGKNSDDYPELKFHIVSHDKSETMHLCDKCYFDEKHAEEAAEGKYD